ncbi:MAG: hypothetical protein J6W74_00125 [Bacteroidales bacterium]|nr:hypothetical protein [Bacteroidales bacterium]MBP5689300.1 hypothetical protein [Bacteroidales bacterium]
MANDVIILTYQVAEAWQGVYSSTTEYRNAAVVQDASGLSVYRSRKSGNVGHPLTDTEWWVCIIDLSSIKAASDDVVALNVTVAGDEAARVLAETGRVNAEASRVLAEQGRVGAEQSRGSAETGRVNAESGRVNAETGRVNAESSRVTAEQTRDNNENNPLTGRVVSEQARKSAETERALAETGRVNAEASRVLAEQGRVNAEAVREQGETNRNNQYAAAEGTESGSVAGDGSRWGAFKAAEVDRDAIAAALRTMLENGTVIPALAHNIASWAERNALNVDDEWTDIIRTAAGDQSIDSTRGARLLSIVAQKDFAATAFKTTGFNLLHDAVELNTGYYFPVPAMAFGTFGTAAQPNGVLFTDNNGGKLTPTVRFKALASGVPTSLSDGDACTYTDSNGYRFYTTPGPGYLIVSGITLANTCAHIAWSRRYDEFISPTEATDAGSSIALATILAAVHSDVSKLLAVGSGATLVSDRIDFDGTNAVWLRKIGRVKPTWTRSDLDAETGLYTYTATISGIKNNGRAEFETDAVDITVNGTTVSYQSESGTATNDYVKYELATTATGSVAISNAVNIEDWGLEILVGATGTAIVTTQYAQGYPDALAQLLANIDQSTVPIICATFAKMQAEIDGLKLALYDAVNLLRISAMRIDTAELYRYGVPETLYCDTAGAPAAARVPKNWDAVTMGTWAGVPRFVGQKYVDRINKKVYVAYTVSNSTNDWVILN